MNIFKVVLQQKIGLELAPSKFEIRMKFDGLLELRTRACVFVLLLEIHFNRP